MKKKKEIVDFLYENEIPFTIFLFNEELYQLEEGEREIKMRVSGGTRIENALFECISKIKKLSCLLVITDCADKLNPNFLEEFEKSSKKIPFDSNLILIDSQEDFETTLILKKAFDQQFFSEKSENISQSLKEFLLLKKNFLINIDTLEFNIPSHVLSVVEKEKRNTIQLIKETKMEIERTSSILESQQDLLVLVSQLSEEDQYKKLEEMKSTLSETLLNTKKLIEKINDCQENSILEHLQSELKKITIHDKQLDELIKKKGLTTTPFTTREDKKKIIKKLSPFFSKLLSESLSHFLFKFTFFFSIKIRHVGSLFHVSKSQKLRLF